MSIHISPIGIIETPFDDLKGMPIQPSGAADVEGTLVINKEYEQGLNDIEGFSHVILLYHFNKSKGFDLMVTPFLDTEERGLFSTRAPRRPNPIGLSIVELIGRKGNKVFVRGIDVLNNTPLIDIKPYIPQFDAVTSPQVGWFEKALKKKKHRTRADDRFADNE